MIQRYGSDGLPPKDVPAQNSTVIKSFTRDGTPGSPYQLGGLSRPSDLAPTALSIQAESAYPQAAGANQNPAHLYAGGGLASKFFTALSNTAGSVAITIKALSAATGIPETVTLTSGTDFTLGADNTAGELAVTATNLAAAINAHSTLDNYLSAIAVAAKVHITKFATTEALALTTDQAARISAPTVGVDGKLTFLNGELQVVTTQELNTYRALRISRIDNIAVGPFAGETSTEDHNVFVGSYAGYKVLAGRNNTIIGDQALSNSTDLATGGKTRNDLIVIGSLAIAPDTNLTKVIAIGNSVTITGSSQMILGSDINPVPDIYLGNGVQYGASLTVTVQPAGGSGTNQIGSDFVVAAGKSTGNATPASIFFATSTAAGSGTTLQTLTNRWRVNGAGGHFIAVADNTYDIGASGATRPRTGYFGTSLISPLFNGLAITNNGTNTLAIAAGKTATISNTLTLAGTDGTTITFQGTDTYVGRATTDTLSNKRFTPRITSISSSATPTINTDNCDAVTITALATAITSMTTNLTGTPVNFDMLLIRLKDDGTLRGITWGASFASSQATLPTTTVASKVTTVGLIWDSVKAKWICIAIDQEP